MPGEPGPESSESEARSEARREAAPVAVIAPLMLAVLAAVSWAESWELVGLPGWVWLVLAVPSLLLTIDLLLTYRGTGLVRSRQAAFVLLGLLLAGNFTALILLVDGLVTSRSGTLGGEELLLTGFAIWATNLVVFALLYWELDAGGPVDRLRARNRRAPDFQFPQDENPQAAADWHPQVWDYLYLSLTNSIAFSPTDTMPLSLRAKAAMGLESFISAVTILLVAARAVNVLGT
jgi:uncharacterized membrane protein